MVRGALILLGVAVVIGALMPEDMGPSAREDDLYAPPPPTMERVVTRDDAEPVDEPSDESADEPTPPAPQQYGVITLQREADGHFYTDVDVNGRPIHFVIDTGASDVALTQEDAKAAAIPFSPAKFDVVGHGASGDVRGTSVSIARVRLGHRTAENIEGTILEGGRQSLLGQNFLSQFESVEIRGNTMTLR